MHYQLIGQMEIHQVVKCAVRYHLYFVRHTLSFPENAPILIFTAVNLARISMIAYLTTYNNFFKSVV